MNKQPLHQFDVRTFEVTYLNYQFNKLLNYFSDSKFVISNKFQNLAKLELLNSTEFDHLPIGSN